jgi:hypothetical protein
MNEAPNGAIEFYTSHFLTSNDLDRDTGSDYAHFQHLSPGERAAPYGAHLLDLDRDTGSDYAHFQHLPPGERVECYPAGTLVEFQDVALHSEGPKTACVVSRYARMSPRGYRLPPIACGVVPLQPAYCAAQVHAASGTGVMVAMMGFARLCVQGPVSSGELLYAAWRPVDGDRDVDDGAHTDEHAAGDDEGDGSGDAREGHAGGDGDDHDDDAHGDDCHVDVGEDGNDDDDDCEEVDAGEDDAVVGATRFQHGVRHEIYAQPRRAFSASEWELLQRPLVIGRATSHSKNGFVIVLVAPPSPYQFTEDMQLFEQLVRSEADARTAEVERIQERLRQLECKRVCYVFDELVQQWGRVQENALHIEELRALHGKATARQQQTADGLASLVAEVADLKVTRTANTTPLFRNPMLWRVQRQLYHRKMRTQVREEQLQARIVRLGERISHLEAHGKLDPICKRRQLTRLRAERAKLQERTANLAANKTASPKVLAATPPSAVVQGDGSSGRGEGCRHPAKTKPRSRRGGLMGTPSVGASRRREHRHYVGRSPARRSTSGRPP